jgi:hypothetical protein
VTNDRFHSLFDGCLDIDPSLAIADLLKRLPSGRGLLLFCDSLDRPIQLLSTASMRAAAAARLAPQAKPVPTKKADLSSVIARIYHVLTYCEFRSALRYRQVAMELYPAEYRKMMNLGRLSLVKIEMTAALPWFSVVQRPSFGPGSRVFGPFPSHKSAIAFAQSLNHAFLLCREPAIASDPAKARSCPYLQMNTCPAPCVGHSSRDEYLQRVQTALQAANGGCEAIINMLRERMLALASEQKFEDANQVKLSLQSLQVLTEPAYKWTCDLQRLAILHIDGSKKVKTPESKKLVRSYAAFLIRPGRIDEFEDVVPSQLEGILALAQEPLAEPLVPAEPLLTDSLLLLESFLYRSNPPGVFVSLADLPSASELASLIETRFAKPREPE